MKLRIAIIAATFVASLTLQSVYAPPGADARDSAAGSNYKAGQLENATDRPVLEPVVFKEPGSLSELVESYPVLQSLVAQVEQQNTFVQSIAAGQAYTNLAQVYVSELLDDEGPNLLFVWVYGSYWCGTGGCHLNVYVDDGTGYREVAPLDYLYPKSPIFIRRGAQGEVSMFICMTEQQSVRAGRDLPAAGSFDLSKDNSVFLPGEPIESPNDIECK